MAAMRMKVVFPMYLRIDDGETIERARELDPYGNPVKPQSRSGFMREAVLMEARRRIALSERPQRKSA